MPDGSATAPSSTPKLTAIVNKGGRWAHRVLIALAESGLEYTITEVDLAHKPDWLVQANPAGQVPVLAVGSPPVYISESADIVEYIASLAPTLQPRGALERARSTAFVQATLRALDPDLLPITSRAVTAPERQIHFRRQLDAVRTIQALLPAEGPYFLGSRFTLADILVAPFMGRLDAYGRHGIAPAGGLTVAAIANDPEYARFRAYLDAITARESWKTTWDERYSIDRLNAKIDASVLSQSSSAPKYPRFLPEPLDPNEVFPEPVPFEHVDRGLSADPALPFLLEPGVKRTELTPVIGTEISGIQLSQLNSAQRDQLALFVAQRGVVVLRDQDFADLSAEQQLEFVRYHGPHYLHPADRHPKGLPEYYSIFQDAHDSSIKRAVNIIDNKLSSVTWHTDGSSELQPPGLTLLFMLETPRNGGGDTLFTSTTEAYERLSPEFQKRLDGLQAEHFLQYSPSRRTPPRNIHPVVRTHPVTRKKILFVNEVNTTKIIGYRKEESDNLIQFLTGHIARAQDIACRVRWEPNTVIVWDNRSTQHTATTNFPSDQRRHLCRITSVAERPF